MKNQSFKSDIVDSLRKCADFIPYLIEQRDDIFKDDRLALIIVYSAIESLIDLLIKKLYKHGSLILKDHRPRFKLKVKLLSEIGVIDDKLYKNLYTLKDLRDKAAHPDKNIQWKGKYSFNKQKKDCKRLADYYGRELNDLARDLFYVWWELYLAGVKALAKKHMVKMKSITQEITKNIN